MGKNMGEVTIIGEISTKFLRGPRRFPLVHLLNSCFLLYKFILHAQLLVAQFTCINIIKYVYSAKILERINGLMLMFGNLARLPELEFLNNLWGLGTE